MSDSGALVVLLTGAASGIGRHLADCLVTRGERLLATDVAVEPLENYATAQGWPQDRVRTARLDVRSTEDWEAAIAAAATNWGRLDVLLNVAGYVHPGWIHEVDAEEIDRHIDINTKGVILGTRAAARQMVKQGHGQIVNIASLAGIAPIPGISLYSASKFAVRGFTLAVAEELRPHGVTVSVVCPDAVDTPMLDKQIDFTEAAMTFSGRRALQVEDVARAVLDVALVRKRLEVTLPRHRAWMAKLTSLWPALSRPLLPRLTQQGLRRQEAARELRKQQ